ncbi:MAG: TRAPP subunit [Cirrosporium novae-zelandiae]|nr:MAG: TRAPP subunit [Cirrosporium novae-zelandiae]
MSYYFAIISPTDQPLFTSTFGTSRAGGDGIARFREDARYLNQFIVHASLDVVEEVQWSSGSLYHKRIDTHPPTSSTLSLFLTPSQTRFILLYTPPPSLLPSTTSTSISASHHVSTPSILSSTTSSSSTPFSRTSLSRTTSSSLAATSTQTDEAMKNFFTEVFELWVKTSMNPFYSFTGGGTVGSGSGAGVGGIDSPVFRGRVIAAGRKWL